MRRLAIVVLAATLALTSVGAVSASRGWDRGGASPNDIGWCKKDC